MSKYITLGPYCYGRANTDIDSLINAVSNCSTTGDTVKFVTFYCSDGTYVNEMGGFNRPAEDPEPQKTTTRILPIKYLDDYGHAIGNLDDGDDAETESHPVDYGVMRGFEAKQKELKAKDD